MIEVKNISKSFGDRLVLNNISMNFLEGQTNLVIGGSGNGKTVLMKSMIGLVEVDTGQIVYDGRDFTKMNFKERKPVRQEIGMVFQGAPYSEPKFDITNSIMSSLKGKLN
jgi:phospholipid/cholesterol/gamma-HCH transport system ATP-binding protein